VRTILLVAAEAREFSGFLRRLRTKPLRVEALAWPVDFARAVEWNGTRMLIVANGPGQRLGVEAATVAFASAQPDAAVSTGVCGGVDPVLRVGDIVVADRVIDAERGFSYEASRPGCRQRFVTASVLSLDRVAGAISDKRSCRERGAGAVEMEAAGVAFAASHQKVPFYCVRSVSDTADEEFALDFNAARDREGRFSRARIAASALAQPWRRIPALARLHRNVSAASESLGEFLADCEF